MKALPEVIRKKKCSNVLIITDAGIRKLGLLDSLETALMDNELLYTIYDKTVANPTTDNVAVLMNAAELEQFYVKLMTKGEDQS